MEKVKKRTYKDLNRQCKTLGLNSDKFGDYPLVVSVPIDCFSQEFDFGEIPDFPMKNLEQVLLIGQTIHNLISQKVHRKIWNWDPFKKKDINLRKKNADIDQIVRDWEPIMEEWLLEGLKKAKSNKKLKISHGQVFEVAKSEVEKMQKMDDYMANVRRDFRRKSAMSDISAGDTFLNA